MPASILIIDDYEDNRELLRVNSSKQSSVYWQSREFKSRKEKRARGRKYLEPDKRRERDA